MGTKVVMVTGAGGNLGRAVVEHLAAEGARLVCVERNPQSLDEVVGALPAGVEVLKVPGIDLADLGACQSAVRLAEDRFGGIDALVNTVGGFKMGSVDEAGLAQWDALLAMNARTAYAISAAVLPSMRRAGYGRIVHIAAAPGLKSGAKQAAYAASKAAVMRLTEAIAAENRALSHHRQLHPARHHRHASEPRRHARRQHRNLGASSGDRQAGRFPDFRRRRRGHRRGNSGHWFRLISALAASGILQ